MRRLYVIFAILSFLILIVPATHAQSGVVRQDGSVLRGRVQIENGKLTVRGSDGRPVEITPETLSSATFAQSVAGAEKPGVLVEYFLDPEFKDPPIATTTSSSVAFGWGQSSPLPGLVLPYGVRVTGQLTPSFSEKYRIEIDVADGQRVWIDDNLIVDQVNKLGSSKFEIDFSDGRSRSFRIEAWEKRSHAKLRMTWSSATQVGQVIPPLAFSHTSVATAVTRASPISQRLARGLLVEYAEPKSPTEVRLVRVEPTIAMSVDKGVSRRGLPKQFVARYSGRLIAPYSEKFWFMVFADDDSAELFIDGKPIAKSVSKKTVTRGSLDLVAGRTYKIELNFKSKNDSARCHVYWASKSQSLSILSPDRLLPPEQVAPYLPSDLNDKPSDHGLLGEYFKDSGFKERVTLRRDDGLSVALKDDSPDAPTTANARWTGTLVAPVTDKYKLTVVAPKCRLTLDNKVLIDTMAKEGKTPVGEATVPLVANRKYNFKLEATTTKTSTVSLQWSTDKLPRQLMPSSVFSPAPLPAAIDLLSPADNQQIDGTQIELKWQATGRELKTAQITIDDTSRDLDARGDRLTLEVAPGLHKLAATAIARDGAVWRDEPRMIYVHDAALAAAGWDESIAGQDLTAGIATLADKGTDGRAGPTLKLTAAVSSLWARNDSVSIVHQKLVGNGSLTAAGVVVPAKAGVTTAGAGIMLRDGLESDAAFFALIRTLDGRLSVVYRNVDALPVWQEFPAALDAQLRIEREGDGLTAEVSPDGKQWQRLVTVEMPIGNEAVGGIVAYTDTTANAFTAEIDQPAVRFDAAADEVIGPGVMTTNGSVLNGETLAISEASVTLRVEGQTKTVARNQCTAVLVRPVKPSRLNRRFNSPGVLSADNDFTAGSITTMNDQQIEVFSDLIGVTFVLRRNCDAVILADRPSFEGFRVTTKAGSWRVPELNFEGSRLNVEDPVLGNVSLSADEIARIDRAG